MMNNETASNNAIVRVWKWLKKPSTSALGSVLFFGMFGGALLWGAFNWTIELSNTEAFCISCHEMEENPYMEVRETIHYSNRSGVRATCPDCHVPKGWIYKVARKISATNELWHKVLGTIDTREKYEDRRLELAIMEWKRMKKTDSQECRNCHDYDYMDYSEQGRRSSRIHEEGFERGETCIDCHKGIAHRLPPMDEELINLRLSKLD